MTRQRALILEILQHSPKHLTADEIFAIARVPGWCAHRVEEVEYANRIIRPAYKYLGEPQEYLPLEER